MADNSDSSSLIIRSIPSMLCEPVYSILHLPTDLPQSIDTTNLIGLYGYDEADISDSWGSEVYIIGDYSDSDSDISDSDISDSGCLVGDSVTGVGDVYISYLSSAESISGNRNWVCRTLPCYGSGGGGGEPSEPEPISLGGAVRFANPPITSLSVPTFIPRVGGRVRPDDSSSSGGGDGACCAHQFTVKAAAGTGITIFDGHNPSSSTAGVFNGVAIAPRSVFLDNGNYYIYIINGVFYALKHTFYSDLIPSLLLATVTKSGSSITVTQHSYQDYPVVYPKEQLSNSTTTFTYSLNYNSGTDSLSVTYKVSASVLRNGSPITFNPTAIPAGESTLYAYAQVLIAEPEDYMDPGASTGIGFTYPQGTEWYKALVECSLTQNSSKHEFIISNRVVHPYIYTFSYFPMNAFSGS